MGPHSDSLSKFGPPAETNPSAFSWFSDILIEKVLATSCSLFAATRDSCRQPPAGERPASSQLIYDSVWC